MNDKQRSYIIFVQNPTKANEVHVRANSWFYVGFAKTKTSSIITRYSCLLRKFKIIDSQLATLKQIYKDFAVTLFWEFKKKMRTDFGLQLNGFMMKYSEIRCIIRQQYQEEHLNIKIKISGKIS